MLLHEFAVEPELLSTWDRFQLFTALFGTRKGRVVSRFPTKWAKKVLKAIQQGPAGDYEKKRCIEKLIAVERSLLVERQHEWSGLPTWIENAILEHGRAPFQAIVAAENPSGHEAVVPWFDLEEDHPRIRVQPGIKIDRTAEAMAGCVAGLLRISAEIVFVDPYFVPRDRTWIDPLRAFLNAAAARDDARTVRRLEYHTVVKEEDPAVFLKSCSKSLAEVVPEGFHLRIVVWKQLHNRFVLTDRGGVMFGWGLRACPGERDNVGLLSESEWAEEWQKHQHQDNAPSITIPEG